MVQRSVLQKSFFLLILAEENEKKRCFFFFFNGEAKYFSNYKEMMGQRKLFRPSRGKKWPYKYSVLIRIGTFAIFFNSNLFEVPNRLVFVHEVADNFLFYSGIKTFHFIFI